MTGRRARWDEIEKLHKAGMSNVAIAEKVGGISRDGVKYALKQMHKFDTPFDPPAPKKKTSFVEGLKQDLEEHAARLRDEFNAVQGALKVL